MTLTGTSSTAIMPGLPTMRRPRSLCESHHDPIGLLVALAGVVLLGVVAIVWTLRDSHLDDPAHRRLAPPTPEPTPKRHPADTPPSAQSPSWPPPAPADAGTTTNADNDRAAHAEPPASLSAADFRRSVSQMPRWLRRNCSGFPGFEVGARVYIDGAGKATRVVPEGRQAGSSFSDYVVKLIRQTRFKKAREELVRATFKL